MRRTTPLDPCPTPATLELSAQGRSPVEVAAHVEACAACRTWVEEIRDNERFLAEAAPDLRALAASEPGLAGARDELPGFEDLRELHRGGQGIVYRAFHRATGRHVAIKVLLHGTMATSRQRARFEREIAIAARLDHPNIVTLYETCTAPGGRAGYVMEYVEGQPLDQWIQAHRSEGARPVAALRQRLEVFAKICGAIAYAHEHGVIHRDLKPQNILLDTAGEPQVLDFGLARSLEGLDHTVTLTGEVLGTFAYAAPEQLTGDSDRIDTRTDVYALGILVYELLTGEHPYPVGGSMAEVIRQVTTTRPTSPRLHNPAIDGELETILLKALAKEPERRYAFAGALLDDIRRYLVGDVIDAKRDSRRYLLRKALRRHRVPASVGGAFVVLITVFAIAMALEARKLEDQLTATSIERGRALATAGNAPLAEDLLWEELLRRAASAGGLDAALDRDAHARAAYWALWELYSAHPCRWSAATEHGPVTCLATAADGAQVATGHHGGEVALRDGRTGHLVAAWQAHPEQVTAISFDGSGERVATGGADGAIRVWQVARRECVASLLGGDGPVSSLAFGPGGTELLSASAGGDFRRWDLADPGCMVVVPCAGGPCVVEPSGRWQAAATAGGFVLGDWVHRAVEIPAASARGAQRVNLAFSDAGDRIAAVGNYRVEIRELPSGRLLGAINDGFPEHIALAGSTPRCATAAADRRIRVWELAADTAPTCALTLSGHRDVPRWLSFGGATPELLVTADRAGTVKCWQLEPTGRRAVRSALVSAHAVTYAPDGRYVALAGEGGVEVVDPATGAVLATLDAEADVVSGLAFDASAQRLVSADHDGTVLVWNWRTGPAKPHLEHGVSLGALVLAADGRRAATGGDDGAIRVLDLDDGRCLAELGGHEGRIPALALHPDGRLLASSGKDGTVRLWDLDRGRALGVLERGPRPIRALAISPDGRLLASGNDGWTVGLWDLASRQLVATLEGQTCDLFALAFSPDGTLLASGGRGSHVKLWDVRSHRCLATVETGLAAVFSLAFDPARRALAIGGAGAEQVVLDLDAGTRHIAGNLEFQLDRLEARGQGVPGAPALRAWARRKLEHRPDDSAK